MSLPTLFLFFHYLIEWGGLACSAKDVTMNPLLGVTYHWLGGLAAGTFYAPFRFVKFWNWEVFWLAGCVFKLVVAPWIAALLLTNNLFVVLYESAIQHPEAFMWTFLFGMMWGVGTLTFGLTMRYLGLSLGMAVVMGFCVVFGALMPPIFKGEFVSVVLGTTSGIVILLGLCTCIIGIAIAALAGLSKEREMSDVAKKVSIKEFAFGKGLLVAMFSGITSAGFAYGLAAAAPIADVSMSHGTDKLWSELPRLCVILTGGLVTNVLACGFLFWKNRSNYQYLATHTKVEMDGAQAGTRVPMFRNYILCAIAGTTWYFQFFFYSMGETYMGIYQFASWPLHMASIMIFSSLAGLVLLEWKGSSTYTKTVLAAALTTLIFSTIVMGYGTHIGKATTENEMRQLSAQVTLLVASVDGKPIVEATIVRTERILELAREVGLSETKAFESVQQILADLEKIDPRTVEHETLIHLDIELRRLTGIDALQ